MVIYAFVSSRQGTLCTPLAHAGVQFGKSMHQSTRVKGFVAAIQSSSGLRKTQEAYVSILHIHPIQFTRTSCIQIVLWKTISTHASPRSTQPVGYITFIAMNMVASNPMPIMALLASIPPDLLLALIEGLLARSAVLRTQHDTARYGGL